jgi:type I restriction enzyme M protein
MSGSSPTARPSGARARIQLVDARDVWTAGGSEDHKRSLGDKRRHITDSQIADIVNLYGRQTDGETSRTFDNADFGYTRVTVERPLRLRYQMTLEDKARFLDACPHLLDDAQAIDKALGREPQRDWNAVWSRIDGSAARAQVALEGERAEALPQRLHAKGPEAEPVARSGRDDGHEPIADLRDFENVPLKEDVDAYFEREVRPHVPDAWMDRAKDKVGYEINFNRHFYKYTPPRGAEALEVIDAELKATAEVQEKYPTGRASFSRANTGAPAIVVDGAPR